MPHGTIAANAARSQSQFSANPCSVVARDTRTPMAATLRAGPRRPAGTHTPERPVDPARVQTQLGAHLDQRFLKAPNEIHHIQRFGQPDDRIADQLPRAVPGDLAAAVGVDDRRCRPTGPFAAAGAAARGVDRRVLEQQQRVGAAGDAGVGQLALQLPGAAVVDGAQLPHVDRSRWPTGCDRIDVFDAYSVRVGQRLADGVVVELEAGPLQRRGDGPLPAEQALVGEFAEQRAQREARAPSAASAGSPRGPAPR